MISVWSLRGSAMMAVPSGGLRVVGSSAWHVPDDVGFTSQVFVSSTPSGLLSVP